MADRGMTYVDSSSLATNINVTEFGPSARPVHASERYANYDFIAVLGLAQRLGILFLPITWQALDEIGRGGQAKINQALVNIETSFAFKRFNSPHPFQEIAQEMEALSRPIIRKHEHIVRLEGVCWDITDDDRVWPVLVFQKTHLGALHEFVRSERFRNLSIDDRLNLCAEIGIAIKDMHASGIIHGDIKPENVLVFEENSQIAAKVADFGFATCFRNADDRILIPKSEPWNAPERHGYPFLPDEAKQMDVYSFGMLCFWLIFEAGSLGSLPLPHDYALKSGQFISFGIYNTESNLLQDWKNDRSNKLAEWVVWLVGEDIRFNSNIKENLAQLSRSTLTFEPKLRCTEFEQLLGLLVPIRDLRESGSIQIDPIPEEENFEIAPSIFDFYQADFRLPIFVFDCLKAIVNDSAKLNVQCISPVNAALQLALCYTLGFGTARDNKQASCFLNKYSQMDVELKKRVQLIDDGIDTLQSESGLYPNLKRQGYIEPLHLPQHYREKGVLERAEMSYEQNIKSIQLVFGQRHFLYRLLKGELSQIMIDQGRWKKAEEIQVKVLEICKIALGAEHRDTLTSMANLALIYWNQGRWKEAEEIQMKVLETSKITLGAEHLDILARMANLAAIYCNQGRWNEAETIQIRLLEVSKTLFGAEHPNTSNKMANLASIYRNQGRWKEAEELEIQIIKTKKRMLGPKHPDTLISMANLASTYSNQGRWKEAEEIQTKVLEISKIVLGAEHPDTLTKIANLALTYSNQKRWKEAEKIQMKVLEVSKAALGVEHPNMLINMANLASTYWNQGRWKEAEEIEVKVLEISKIALGAEHPNTLTSMANLALTYSNQGRWKEAEELEAQVMEVRTETPRHAANV